MDAERMTLLATLSNQGIAFKDAFESLYEDYSVRKKSLSETLRQSPIHGNPAFPAPSTVDTRYLNEDLPFGLAPWSSIGRKKHGTSEPQRSASRVASILTSRVSSTST